jgi:DNA-binding CsgD family transcriptional regulator
VQVLVLDHAFRVESTSEGALVLFQRWPALEADGAAVPQKVARFVREQAAAYRAAGLREVTALMFPDLLVHIVDLQGPVGTKLVAAFTGFAVRDPIRQAARNFNLTAREGQVLALLLRGLRAADIAKALALSEMTVGDYFKRLRRKTGARTQSGMIARLLGWGLPGGTGLAADIEDTR